MADEIDELEVSDRRQGRGRLSSIEMLPDEAEEHIAWANQQLRDRSMPQNIILVNFNARLAAIGLKPISKGAFSRYSVRVAIEARKLEAARQINEAVLSRMSPEDRSDGTLAAIELLKFRIMAMVMDDEEPDLKLLDKAALIVSRLSKSAVLEAEGQRRERRDQREEAERSRIAQAAETAAAVEKIASEAGLGAAAREGVLKRIREDVYGIFDT